MEAQAARELVNTAVRSMQKAAVQKSLQADTRDLLYDLAVAGGIVQHGKQPDAGAGFRLYLADLRKQGKDRPDLAAWVERVGVDGYPVDIDPYALGQMQGMDYTKMPLAEFTALKDAFAQIRHIDRLERTVMQDGKRRALAALRGELVAAADANGTEVKRAMFERDRPWNKTKTVLAGVNASLTKIEMACLKMDGYVHGVWWNSLFKPIADAENARNTILKSVRANLKALTDKLFTGPKERYAFFKQRVRVSGIQESLTLSQIVAIALNTGNAVNKERLLTGFGWTEAQLDAVLDYLDKKHWEFAQGVWDFLETFKADSFALQRELTGKEPVAVEAQLVQTKFGDFRGGYYPIVYNKALSFKAWERAMKDMGDSIYGGTSYGTMQTRKGHLIERKKAGSGEPVSDDLNVIVKHLFDVVHDVTHRRAIMDVAKLLRDPVIGGSLEKYLGPELRKEFKPWLQNIARETEKNAMAGNVIDKFWGKARNATTLFYLGWKLTSILMQVADLPGALVQKGKFKSTLKGIGALYLNPFKTPETMRGIFEKSPFMASRMENFDREFKDAIHGLQLIQGSTDAIKKTSMKGIEIIQMAIDMPIWQGAYEAELKKNWDEARAVAVADSTVRLTTGSGSTKDLASVQRGQELWKLFTMFYTAFSAHYNLHARRINQARKSGWKDVPGLAFYAFSYYLFMPALGMVLTGRGPDGDEGEEWGDWALNIALREPFQTIPIVRDAVSVFDTVFGYDMSPAVTPVKSVLRFGAAVKKAIEDESTEKLAKPTAEFAGVLTGGLITKQHITTVGNVWDYMTGETPDFELRDLFFNKPKSRR